MEKRIKSFDKRIYSLSSIEKAIADFNSMGSRISLSKEDRAYSIVIEGESASLDVLQGEFCNYLILLENRRGADL